MTVGLALTACGLSAPSNAPAYQAYTYTCCFELTGQDSWRPGQHRVLHWRPQSGASSAATARTLHLALTLTGPFPSVDALKQGISQSTTPAASRTVTLAAVEVPDRPVQAPASDIQLPVDLAPGYYNLNETVSEATSSVGGAAVIVVR